MTDVISIQVTPKHTSSIFRKGRWKSGCARDENVQTREHRVWVGNNSNASRKLKLSIAQTQENKKKPY
jgi:hypothetical protein